VLDLAARQREGQHLWFGNPHFFEQRPAGDLDAIQVEAQQRVFGHLHRAAGVMFVLAQEEEILPDLVLGERGRVARKVFG